MSEQVTFGDVTISDYWPVLAVGRPIAGRSNATRNVSGMHGTLVTGSVMETASASIVVLIGSDDQADRREAMRQLASMLHSDEPQRLMFSSDNGLYYMAILDAEVPVSEHVRADAVTVNFLVASPILYGREMSVTVPSGGSVTFNVGGTHKAFPMIVAAQATGAANAQYLWGLRLDEGKYVRVATGSDSAKSVTIDCDGRTAKVDGSLTLPTLDSDWLELTSGMHTLRNDVGGGSAIVTWRERWL